MAMSIVLVAFIAIFIYLSETKVFECYKVGKSGDLDHSHTMQHTNKKKITQFPVTYNARWVDYA
jgi:hypothetical protein